MSKARFPDLSAIANTLEEAVWRLVDAIERLTLAWDIPPPEDPPMIENQQRALRLIAEQPGSIISGEEPYRIGTKPARYRTIQRLITLGYLELLRADDIDGTVYIQLTVDGWDRIATKVDKA